MHVQPSCKQEIELLWALPQNICHDMDWSCSSLFLFGRQGLIVARNDIKFESQPHTKQAAAMHLAAGWLVGGGGTKCTASHDCISGNSSILAMIIGASSGFTLLSPCILLALLLSQLSSFFKCSLAGHCDSCLLLAGHGWRCALQLPCLTRGTTKERQARWSALLGSKQITESICAHHHQNQILQCALWRWSGGMISKNKLVKNRHWPTNPNWLVYMQTNGIVSWSQQYCLVDYFYAASVQKIFKLAPNFLWLDYYY
jgi:hypothetical protein